MEKRFEFVDALRGMAVLLVVAQHIVERIDPDFLLLRFCNFGRTGVILFFVISGYVVPMSIKGQRPVHGFFRSRAFRLLPALWLSIAAELAINGMRAPQVVLANMAMLAGPLHVEPLSGVYWTLTYELFFYVYCGVLFSAKLLYVPRISGIFGIALTMIAVGFGNEDFSFFAYLLLGHLLRLAGQDDTRGARRWAGALMVALLVADANLAARVQYDPLFSPTALFVAMTAPVLGFLLAARMRRIAITPLLWLGSISYSIYLFHGLVLASLAFLAVPAPLLFAASVIAGTLASAALVYNGVEKPFITLGRKGRVALPTAQAI